MECLDGYGFEIRKHYANKPLWDYLIFCNTQAIIESCDWFQTEQEARFAAIGQITQLQGHNGD